MSDSEIDGRKPAEWSNQPVAQPIRTGSGGRGRRTAARLGDAARGQVDGPGERLVEEPAEARAFDEDGGPAAVVAGRPDRRPQRRGTKQPRADRRSEQSRRAILAAARELLAERGMHGLTIEGVAARAGVGKQTIYRWWESKATLAIEATREATAPSIGFPDTGDLPADLATVLRGVATLLADPTYGAQAAGLLAETTRDPAALHAFQTEIFGPVRAAYLERLERARERGELREGIDDEELLDAAFGPLWFRLLTRPGTLEPGVGERIAGIVVDGVRPRG